MAHELSEILNLVDQNIRAILWLTEDALSNKTLGFNELNYLFDGLISDFLVAHPNKELNSIQSFFSKSFGNDICLVHISGNEISSGTIDEQIAFIKTHLNQSSDVVVLNFTNKDWESELKKRYSQLHFKFLIK
jgi:hypothetical protein